MILFYAKNGTKNIWNEIRISIPEEEIKKKFPKIDKDGRRYTTIPLHAPGETNGATGGLWHGMYPPKGRHWRTDPKELDRIDQLGLIEWSSKGNPRIKKFADEHKGMKIQDVWTFKDPQYPVYPTEKNLDMLSLIIKQSSHPSSVVLDCFSGSGNTLLAASLEGRKFIGVDQSKVSIKTIQKKLDDYIYEFVPLKNNTL